MDIEAAINELEHIRNTYGNIPVQLQDDGSLHKDGLIQGHNLFIVPEEYDDGKGMGYWFRGHTEHLLLGVRGKVKAFRSPEHNILRLPVKKHSEKPEEFRRLIERATANMSSRTRIELFARERIAGWDAWGNEVESDITL